MSSRQRPVLFLCGDEKFELGEFKKLEKLAIEMNARVYDRSRKFDDNVTHVIYHSIGNAPQLTKSVMCGLAAGKWVVYHSFLSKSARKKSWTNEKDHLLYPACIELRKINENSGPFLHMRAVIISNDDLKVEAYTSVIKAGGGIVYDKIKGIRDLSGRKWQSGNLTHVLLDLAYMKPTHRFYDLLADFIKESKVFGNVRFLYFRYIPEYLREGGHVKEDRYDLLKPEVLTGYLRRENKRRGPPHQRKGLTKKMKTEVECVVIDSDDDEDDIEVLFEKYELEKREQYQGVKFQNYTALCRTQKNQLREQCPDIEIIDEVGKSAPLVELEPVDLDSSVEVSDIEISEDEEVDDLLILDGISGDDEVPSDEDEGQVEDVQIPTQPIENSSLSDNNIDKPTPYSGSDKPQSVSLIREDILNTAQEAAAKHPVPTMSLEPLSIDPEPIKSVSADVLEKDKVIRYNHEVKMARSRIRSLAKYLKYRFRKTYENDALSYSSPAIANYSPELVRTKVAPSDINETHLVSEVSDEESGMYLQIETVLLSWFKNQYLDKFTFNFVFRRGLLLQTDAGLCLEVYRFISTYTFLNLTKVKEERTKFMERFLSSICSHLSHNFDLNNLHDQAKIKQVFLEITRIVIKSTADNSKLENCDLGPKLALTALVNIAQRDFLIWWRFCRRSKTTSEEKCILYYLLHGGSNLLQGFKETVLSLYITFLKHDLNTELPRRLLAMTSLLQTQVDRKQGLQSLEDRSKVELAKKISEVLQEVGLSPTTLYTELALLRPNWLSARVSSFMSSSNLNIRSLNDRMNKLELTQDESERERERLVLENGLHRLTACTNVHSIYRAERHFGVSNEKLSVFNIAEELGSRVQALHLDEVLIPLEEEKEGEERDEKEKKSTSLTIINQLQFIDTCATRKKKLTGASRSLFFKFDSSEF